MYTYRSQRKGRREAPQEKMPPRQTELKINLKTIQDAERDLPARNGNNDTV